MGLIGGCNHDKRREEAACAADSMPIVEKPRPAVRRRSAQLRANGPDKPDTTPDGDGIPGTGMRSGAREE